jgi:hypothetical protein
MQTIAQVKRQLHGILCWRTFMNHKSKNVFFVSCTHCGGKLWYKVGLGLHCTCAMLLCTSYKS